MFSCFAYASISAHRSLIAFALVSFVLRLLLFASIVLIENIRIKKRDICVVFLKFPKALCQPSLSNLHPPPIYLAFEAVAGAELPEWTLEDIAQSDLRRRTAAAFQALEPDRFPFRHAPDLRCYVDIIVSPFLPLTRIAVSLDSSANHRSFQKPPLAWAYCLNYKLIRPKNISLTNPPEQVRRDPAHVDPKRRESGHS
jgi:hypothetical protein